MLSPPSTALTDGIREECRKRGECLAVAHLFHLIGQLILSNEALIYQPFRGDHDPAPVVGQPIVERLTEVVLRPATHLRVPSPTPRQDLAQNIGAYLPVFLFGRLVGYWGGWLSSDVVRASLKGLQDAWAWASGPAPLSEVAGRVQWRSRHYRTSRRRRGP